MTSPSVAYPLRPAKFVDRALFVEMLQRVDRWSAIRDAVYIGFGGPCMEDHRMIHAALGLKHLISIEKDQQVFLQQMFNRPLREIVCVHREAKDFVDEFEAEIRRAKATRAAQRIIWFDYEAPDDLMSQLQTLQALIGLANDGDVIRITLNAHAGSLGGARENETEDALQKRRLEKLTTRFGDFLPENLVPQDTQNARYPNVVLEAVKLAALRATSESGRTFLPVLLVQYADGQPMLTVAGVVLADDDVQAFLKRTDLKRWPFFADNWSNLELVQKAPALTMRERMHLDQALIASSRLPKKLGYLSAQGGAPELIRMYRRYQRFFPQFQHVDL